MPTYTSISKGQDTTVFTLTAAQVKALNGSPLTLLPAPGANSAYQLLDAYCTMTYNTVAYSTIDGGDAIELHYTNAGGEAPVVFSNGTLTSASSQREFVPAARCAPVPNAPIVAYVPSGNPLFGNSLVKIGLTYRIVPALL